jgi:hypothetical protein
LPTELPPSLEVPEALPEVSEPELDPDPDPEPEPEPELEPAPLSTPSWEALEEEPLSEVSEPELDPDPDPEPEPEPDLEPEPELAPLSTPSWEAVEEEPPQPAKTTATIRATYGEVRFNLFAMSLFLPTGCLRCFRGGGKRNARSINRCRFTRWSLPPLRGHYSTSTQRFRSFAVAR